MEAAKLKRFIQLFRGGSVPTEIETEDGRHCILKMRGAGNGPQSLIHEFVVNRVLAGAGWPAPNVFPVFIPDDFPWNFGTDEFDEILQRSSGINLGIELIEGGNQISTDQARNLEHSFLERMACADALFCNFDRLEASCNVLTDVTGRPWMIDHGGCLFLIPNIASRPFTLAAHHMLKDREAEFLSKDRVKELCRLDLIHSAVNDVPQAWLDSAGFTRENMKLALEQRISLALAD